MGRIALLGLILVLLAACATPQGIKEVSRQQVDLIREFHRALGDLRTKLLVFYDEEIEEFRQDLLKNRMASEGARVSERVYEAIRKIDPALTKEQRMEEVKEILEPAANYLTQLPDIYFMKNYCEEWDALKKDFLREPGEKCDQKHVDQYQELSAGRKEVAERFDQVVMNIGRMREVHDLVNEFLQIEFRLTREQVDEAKRVMEKLHKTVEDSKAAWIQFREKKGETQ